MKTAANGKIDAAQSRDAFAKKLIGAFDNATKIIHGKLPRPKTNWDEQFKEWDGWVEEIKNERGRRLKFYLQPYIRIKRLFAHGGRQVAAPTNAEITRF